jgi:hypothetical protein
VIRTHQGKNRKRAKTVPSAIIVLFCIITVLLDMLNQFICIYSFQQGDSDLEWKEIDAFIFQALKPTGYKRRTLQYVIKLIRVVLHDFDCGGEGTDPKPKSINHVKSITFRFFKVKIRWPSKCLLSSFLLPPPGTSTELRRRNSIFPLMRYGTSTS